ncbi:hypothetical protein IWZ00DRAFT_507970 [Phyllosticta capitalensis]
MHYISWPSDDFKVSYIQQTSAPEHHSTPISEWDRNQKILSLSFPTLYPFGKADFAEPRLRSVTLDEYFAYEDPRFARHPRWSYFVFSFSFFLPRSGDSYFIPDRPQIAILAVCCGCETCKNLLMRSKDSDGFSCA